MKQVRFGGTLDFQGVCVNESGDSAKQVNIVTPKLIPDDPGFALDYLRYARAQVANGNSVFYNVIASVKGAMPEPGQVENRFPQRLAWDRSSVDANPSNHFVAVHHGYALAKLCRGDRAFLPGWSAANYDQVVPDGLHHASPARLTRTTSPQRRISSGSKFDSNSGVLRCRASAGRK